MVILDICAKHRHLNGGLMRINDIIDKYQNKMKNKIIPYKFIDSEKML